MAKTNRSEYTPLNFKGWHAQDALDITPKFRRRGVWTTPAKSYLIDLLQNRLPSWQLAKLERSFITLKASWESRVLPSKEVLKLPAPEQMQVTAYSEALRVDSQALLMKFRC
jgi:hypothetical protein